jgi:hypothetical protein
VRKVQGGKRNKMTRYRLTLTNGKAVTLEATGWLKQGNAVTFFRGSDEVTKHYAEAVEKIEVLADGSSFVAYRREEK